MNMIYECICEVYMVAENVHVANECVCDGHRCSILFCQPVWDPSQYCVCLCMHRNKCIFLSKKILIQFRLPSVTHSCLWPTVERSDSLTNSIIYRRYADASQPVHRHSISIQKKTASSAIGIKSFNRHMDVTWWLMRDLYKTRNRWVSDIDMWSMTSLTDNVHLLDL